MKGLKFRRLVLLSDSTKKANQFVFPKRLNLITGNDNSIGKSTLVKCIYWSLGCEPYFDNTWRSQDVKTILYFSVNDLDYVVSRYKDGIYFGREGYDLKKYHKITGDFSIDFAEEVGFFLKIVSRNDEIECPPPAFYFLPFYIDQKKSWDQPWSGFDALGQYSNFKKNVAKYFCGYLPFDHFELEEDKLEQKLIEKEASSNIGRLDETMDILKEFLPSSEIATSKEELEVIQKEIEEELKSLSEKQILLFDKQINLENDIHELEQQHLIASAAINDLDKDYNFAVENVIEDLLTCPLCGTDHDNSLLSRAGILSDKDSLEDQKIKIEYDLIAKYETRKEIAEELKIVSDEIDRINDKYLREEDSDLKIFDQVIHSISQKKVNEKIISRKEIFQVEIQNSKDQQKNIAKEQKGLLSKERKEELNSYFLGNLVESIKSIAATGVNLDGVKTPMDYNKILGGGAAEGTRGVLAYQLAILKQIDYAASCQISPFIIDTPNQQEQAKHRYDKVIDVVVDSVPKGYQIILCAMENKALDNYKKDAHVIRLDEDKLLKKEKYKELSKEYDEIILKV